MDQEKAYAGLDALMSEAVDDSKIFGHGTLVSLLHEYAHTQSNQMACAFLENGDEETERLTYFELDARARSVAAKFQSLGLMGERVLLILPSGLRFIEAFLACLYAGATAVPLALFRSSRMAERMGIVLEDSKATAIVGDAVSLCVISKIFAETIRQNKLLLLDVDEIPKNSSEQWTVMVPDGEMTAFLQYTSGSTGRPKGVMVSHSNIMHNSWLINKLIPPNEPVRVISWLPHYHDMGLIGGILQPLYAGGALHLLPPKEFLRCPILWLKGMSRYRCTATGAPNFAYELCLRHVRPEQRDALDLSSMVAMFNGAEAVRPETVERFYDFFKSCGLRKEALTPCYGMAETTLLVTGKPPQTAPVIENFDKKCIDSGTASPCVPSAANKTRLVGCGAPAGDMDVVIVDPSTLTTIGDGQIGEIMVRGGSVAKGYWNKSEASRKAFVNTVFGHNGKYLQTGDLGFLHGGNLFITGRCKDLIIIRGRNIYPDDLEALAEHTCPELVTNGTVAIGVETDGEEQLMMFCEIDRVHRRKVDGASIAEAIRIAVFNSHELQIHTFGLCLQGALPKTSSGKIRRGTAKRLHIVGELKTIFLESNDAATGGAIRMALPDFTLIAEEDRAAMLSNYLQEMLAYKLRVPQEHLDEQTPLAAVGLDSLLATQLAAMFESDLKVEIAFQDLAEASIGSLARTLVEKLRCRQFVVGRDEANPRAIPVPRYMHDPFPMTSIQQAYWLGRRSVFSLGNVATHVYFELDCHGLDADLLSFAWQRLIERHEMLRAVILPDGTQKILEHVPEYHIAVNQFSGLEPDKKDEELSIIRDEMGHQVLSAENWPLFDIRISNLGNNQKRLHFSIDLLIADMASILLLCKELKTLYTFPHAILPDNRVSYRDYVLAENEFKRTEKYQTSRDYWLRRLPELPAAPHLPIAVSLNSIVTPKFTRRCFELTETEWTTIRNCAADCNVTPTSILLTAFADVLANWSSSPIFTLNLTFSRRLPVHDQIDNIVGDFTSLLPLAVDATSSMPFQDRALRMQKQLWSDLEHRWADGVEILRDLNRRQNSHSSVLPIVFTSGIGMNTAGFDSNSLLSLGQIGYSVSQTPQVWLDHQVIEKEGGLFLSWDTVDSLFPKNLVNDMFNAYKAIVRRLIQDVAFRSQTLKHATPAAQIKNRDAVNATGAEIVQGVLFDPIYEQVRHNPSRAAVICSGFTLSYEEMWQRAMCIANWLGQQDSVKPNTLVAVVMEKGWEQVVAVLGIQMAGAAYLPIDPDLPAKRRDLLIANGEARCILTQSRLETIEFSDDLPKLSVDACDITDVAVEPPARKPHPEDLAYVIYTSGSTGIPKGVMIEHVGAMNTIVDINKRFTVNENDRVLALSALNFDLSVYDIFGLLAAGGALVMPEHARRKDPQHWLELMEQHEITLWNSVPALLQMAVEYCLGLGCNIPPSLRLVMLSGDWIPTDLPAKLRVIANHPRLISLGGATEASIWSIFYPIEEVAKDWSSIPYGKPLRNQTFHVLDDTWEPKPVWVPGELYIGGIGQARGYWGDEEKTRNSFVTNPITGERLYRTGDLGRYLPDGNIEFLGRKDFQVKISGYRIELGEIEAALKEHPKIKDTVVIATGDQKGEKHLVGYAVPAQGEKISQNEIQDFLRGKLVEYMIPGALMILDALPMTPNGKVDRKELPLPEQLPSKPEVTYVAPRNELEQTIASVLQKVLEIKRASIHDKFFNLGANSLHIVRIQNNLKKILKQDITVLDLFENTTISDLAQYLTRNRGEHRFVQQARGRAEARKEATEKRKTRKKSLIKNNGMSMN